MISTRFHLWIPLLLCGLLAHGQDSLPAVRVNQLGYYPFAPKLAIVCNPGPVNRFFVVTADGGDTVYRGVLDAEVASAYSSYHTRVADFTGLQQKGVYKILVPGVGNSWPFAVDAGVMNPVAVSSLKGFYYQRSNQALLEKYAGKWTRPAGHPDTKVLVHSSAATQMRPEGTVIATPGGWYDAGDYNKYVVNAGITMGTLLSAYEDFPSWFAQLHTNIPESNDGVPDILNETIYELRWMLTMQDPVDGGVYNKCTNAAFDGMVMPGVTTLPRYVVAKGAAATLDFAAVTAQAARILAGFKKQFPGLSDSCLQAAERAWQWAQKNPALAYNQESMNRLFRPAITTGGYGDRQFTDEWFWAAAELLATTKDQRYAAMVNRSLREQPVIPTWNNVRALGVYTLYRNKTGVGSMVDGNTVKKVIRELSDRMIINGGNKAFHTMMGQSAGDFVWGSNAVAANQGVALINTYLVTGDIKYVTYALDNLDYLLGRNATGYCFVTGAGSMSPQHPHHRPSVADGVDDPVPGLLVGGPNPGKQDGCKYASGDPATTYLDADCSYASNEIAINWNAPLVYLVNAIEALQYKIVFSKK